MIRSRSFFSVQCTSCWEDNVAFDKLPEVPHLVLAIFVEKPTPFLEEFFLRMLELDYPKDKIDLFIHNSEEFHVHDVEALLSELKLNFSVLLARQLFLLFLELS